MSAFALSPAKIASLVYEVCELDVRAFKPGNVSLESPGHRMTAADFIKSAEAVTRPLSLPGLSLGERILFAIRSTHAAVGCNTNLGIVLLLAPLAQAALLETDEADLGVRVERVLASLTKDDAALAFEAIRVAAPAGLGASRRLDVNSAPTGTLLEAMREAQDRDQIARQYATNYRGVLDTAAPLARAALERWQSHEWATVAVYLHWLATVPDTHVERKFGRVVAERVRKQAVALDVQFQAASSPDALRQQLQSFDQELKHGGINPGTSADLTVASLMAMHLQEHYRQQVNDRLADEATGYYPQRASARAFH